MSLPKDEGEELTPTQQLIDSCQGLVRNLAWQVHQRVKARIELDDLIAYGQVGLAEAAARYDPGQGTRFITYAYHRVRGAIFDGLAKMGWFSPADFYRGRYERLANELLEASEAFDDESLDDGARWFADVSVRLSIAYLGSGLSAAADETGGEIWEDPDAAAPPIEAAMRELQDMVRARVTDLPDQARSLVEALYFDGLSLTAASARLGISKSWASRLHDRTLRQLAVALRQSGLEQVA